MCCQWERSSNPKQTAAAISMQLTSLRFSASSISISLQSWKIGKRFYRTPNRKISSTKHVRYIKFECLSIFYVYCWCSMLCCIFRRLLLSCFLGLNIIYTNTLIHPFLSRTILKSNKIEFCCPAANVIIVRFGFCQFHYKHVPHIYVVRVFTQNLIESAI